MAFLDTTHKRKSAIYTSIIMLLLLLVVFFFGMTYLDPPEENGIAINFGTTATGSGNVQPTEPIKAVQEPNKPEPTEVVEKEIIEKQEPQKAEASTLENVLTQDTEDAIAIKKAEAEKQRKDAAAKKVAEAEAKKIKAQKAAEEKARKEREAKQKKLDAMMGGINSSNGNQSGGEGNDNTPGDKGQIDGDLYANSYYGSGKGQGSGGLGYGLKNRHKKGNTSFKPKCNAVGRIVVQITVNKNGKVTDAKYISKGSTASDNCLIEPALKTARSFKWNADSDAPASQIGFIVINFALGQ